MGPTRWPQRLSLVVVLLITSPAAAVNVVAPTAPQAPSAPAPPAAAATQQPDGGNDDEGRADEGRAAEGEADDAAQAAGQPFGQGAAPGANVDPFVPRADPTQPSSATSTNDPPARIGRLSFLRGKVSVRAGTHASSNDGGVWLEASRNRPLVTGDSIWVDKGGLAELHLGAVEVRLAAETLLQVQQLSDAEVRLGLLQGTLEVRQRPGDEAFRPTELCPPGLLVRTQAPGLYRLSVDRNGSLTALAVEDNGEAKVISERGSREVASGQVLHANNDAGEGLQVQPAATSTHQVDPSFVSWSNERAAAQAQPESLRYVSRNMVGYEDLDSYGSWSNSPTYGPMWAPTQVSVGWAPFRFGHWENVLPWGWTWVDDAPWGFAPFHYGRWVSVQARWYWAPGSYAAYPIYAPHLVAFAGPRAGFGFGTGYVGWYPLGFYDPFYPAYPCSYAYTRGINGPRPLFGSPFGNHGGLGGYGGGGPHGYAGHGPVVMAGVTVVPRQTVLGGAAVGNSYRPISAKQGGAAWARAGWNAHMPVQAPVNVVGRPGAAPHFAATGAAARPPAAAWGRSPQITRVGGYASPARSQPGSMNVGPARGYQGYQGYNSYRAPVGGGGRAGGWGAGYGGRPYGGMPAYRYEPAMHPNGFSSGGGGFHFHGHMGGAGGVRMGGHR